MPFVSIIIPCRNEKEYISKCLESLLKQDYPKESLEVLVLDGMSSDGTREIVSRFSSNYPFIRMIDNHRKFTTFALNIGVRNSKGDFIIRMDAHADYQPDYISKCIGYSLKCNADNVGGPIRTLPARNTLQAKSIALVLSHWFGAGNSFFRTGVSSLKWVDTVFGGCFKKEAFQRVGMFNEKMIRSQDIEFNSRLRRAGGKILLAPDIVANYYPQSNLKDFLLHNLLDGYWTIYPLKFKVRFFSWRHLLPLFFVLSLVVIFILSLFLPVFKVLLYLALFSYLLIDVFISLALSLKERNILLVFILPFAFFCRHFGYGLGSFWALFRLLI